MAQLLIDEGARVTEVVSSEKDGSMSRTNDLFEALSEKHDTLKTLLENGADPEITDSEGNSVLMAASEIPHGSYRVKTLLKFDVDINRQNKWGETALFLAVRKGCTASTVKMLLEKGADVNLRTNSNCTAMRVCLNKIFYNSDTLLCIEYLLDHGAETSGGSEDALQRLIEADASWLVPRIIQKGCSPQQQGNRSPLRVALAKGNIRVARYLLGNTFLTKSDIISTEFNSCHPNCQDLLCELISQPFSLATLSFVEVSSALGSGPDRQERVRNSELPMSLQRKLLFETEDVFLMVDEKEKKYVLDKLKFCKNSASDDESD